MKGAARLLLVLGTVVIVVGLSKVHAAWVATDAYDYTGSSRFSWSVLYIGLLVVMAYGLGLPDLATGARGAVGPAVAAPLVAAGIISVAQLATGDALLPRYVVFGSMLLVVPWNLVCVALAAGGRTRAEERERVVVVARPEVGDDLVRELASQPERSAMVVGRLDSEASPATEQARTDLLDLATESEATLIVLDRHATDIDALVAQAAALHDRGVRVRTLGLFYEEWLGKLPVSELERISLMFDIGELHRARYGRMKRIADVVVSSIGLVAVVGAGLVIVVGNLVGNRGPLLYRQERVGRFGHTFTLVKFRTMRPTGGSLHNDWTAEDDPRITPFGRWLRISHLDELPQMWNVLRGDLSIVGPRPEQPRYVDDLVEKIPFYDLRHRVRPGLTGWAQVKYGYAGNERDALEKLQYDFYYLRHQGLGLDARILMRTLRSVIGSKGR